MAPALGVRGAASPALRRESSDFPPLRVLMFHRVTKTLNEQVLTHPPGGLDRRVPKGLRAPCFLWLISPRPPLCVSL